MWKGWKIGMASMISGIMAIRDFISLMEYLEIGWSKSK